jgi:Mn2+/Fe2+ NRAMP family transporter
MDVASGTVTARDPVGRTSEPRRSLWAMLGPGLLWAGTAIGVSHLVQSTRAGADFGLTLLWLVVLANVMKYPGFEAAPRYTGATGRSLLHGYQRLGRWVPWVFLLLTVATMFTVVGAVTLVTAGMAKAMVSDSLSSPVWAAIILGVSALIIGIGRFSVLDTLMKLIMIGLTISTIVCVIALIPGLRAESVPLLPMLPELDARNVGFMVALVGWMPTALDIAVWHSLWSLDKSATEGRKVELRESLFDFRVGYVGTTLSALCFVFMGAAVLHGRGMEIPNEGGAFASLFVGLYVEGLGEWARPFVLLAAFTTMFSTALTCLDGFPRALTGAIGRMRAGDVDRLPDGTIPELKRDAVYWLSLAIVASGALVLIFNFAANLKGLVDLATTLSFLSAPLFAVLNLRVLRSDDVPPEARPTGPLLAFHVVGLVFQVAFALYYLSVRFGG